MGNERGRRNTGYWAPFNVWWRAHLEKHGERPKAEDLKRWFQEEARNAFPNEPPTYTMIRNHAKGLRDIASVKHYFRDYRARKRRAVADLAGEPSPRSEPDADEEDRDSGSGCPTTDSGCTSDEDWKEEARRSTRERRRKRPQSSKASSQSQPDSKQQRHVQAQAHADAQPSACPQQQPPQQQRRLSFGLQAPHMQADPGVDEGGDLTVTVTVTQGLKQEPLGCTPAAGPVPQLDSPRRPGPSARSQHQPPLRQQLLRQQRPDLDDAAATGTPSSHSTGTGVASLQPTPLAGAQSVGGSVAQDWASPAWRLNAPVHMDGSSAARGHGRAVPAGGRGHSQEDTPRTASVPAAHSPPSCLSARYIAKLGGEQQGLGKHASLPVDPQLFPPLLPGVHAQPHGGGAAGGVAGAAGAFGGTSAAAAAAAATPACAGQPAQQQPHHGAATQLSPMSSQPVPPADAASTASTDGQRAVNQAMDVSGAPAGASAGIGGGAAQVGAGGRPVPNPSTAAAAGAAPAAAGAGGGFSAGSAGPALAGAEELYVGLHGAASAALDSGGEGQAVGCSTPASRVPSGTAGGLQCQPQSWTPFAMIPVAQVVEDARHSTDSGAGPSQPPAPGVMAEKGSSVSMFGLRALSESRPSVLPAASAAAAAADFAAANTPSAAAPGYGHEALGAGLGLAPAVQRSPVSVPCLDERAAPRPFSSWQHRSHQQQQQQLPMHHQMAAVERHSSAPVPVQPPLAGCAPEYHHPYHSEQQAAFGQLPPAAVAAASAGGVEAIGMSYSAGAASGRRPSVEGGYSPVGRQMSLPTFLYGGDQPAAGGGGGYTAASPRGRAPPPLPEPAPQPSLAAGPPPITTGFTPSKNTARPGAAMAIGGVTAGATAATSGLQAPSSGAGPLPLAGHAVLTGVSTAPAAAPAPSSALQPASSMELPPCQGSTQDAFGCGALGLSGLAAPPPRAGGLIATPTAAPAMAAIGGATTTPVGARGGCGGRPMDPAHGASTTPVSVPLPRFKSSSLPAFPPPFAAASPPPPLSSCGSGSSSQNMAAGVGSGVGTGGGGMSAGAPPPAPPPPPRLVRWVPYPHAMHARMPPPPGWHGYPYPPIPGYPPGPPNMRGLPAGYPPQYLPYMVRRRYPAGPPLPQQEQQQPLPQQPPQQQPLHSTAPSSRIAPSGAVPAMPGAWPAGRTAPLQASRAQAVGLLSQDPWVTAGYENLTPTGSAGGIPPSFPSSGSGSAPRMPEQRFMPAAMYGAFPGSEAAAVAAPPPPHPQWAGAMDVMAFGAVEAPAVGSGGPHSALPAPGRPTGANEPLTAGDECIIDSLWAMCSADDEPLGSIFFSSGEFGSGGPPPLVGAGSGAPSGSQGLARPVQGGEAQGTQSGFVPPYMAGYMLGPQ